MYISQNISIKTRTDHNIYITKELDLTFVEILLPNQAAYVLGTITNIHQYKAPQIRQPFLWASFKIVESKNSPNKRFQLEPYQPCQKTKNT